MLCRPTINLPGRRRGKAAEFPDNERTAVLVGRGILVPVNPIEGPASDDFWKSADSWENHPEWFELTATEDPDAVLSA